MEEDTWQDDWGEPQWKDDWGEHHWEHVAPQCDEPTYPQAVLYIHVFGMFCSMALQPGVFK